MHYNFSGNSFQNFGWSATSKINIYRREKKNDHKNSKRNLVQMPPSSQISHA